MYTIGYDKYIDWQKRLINSYFAYIVKSYLMLLHVHV